MTEKRKLAAILAADVVGFSRLAGGDEEGTLARLRTLWSDLIAPTISVHNGRVVKRTGDGSIIEFRSVVDAVRCAIEVQNGMIERNAGLPPERRIEFRIGIHLGDVVEESDGDLMGDGVNIAARLEGIAKPGAICLSEDAYRQVRGKIPIDFIDMGEHQLKNIFGPIRTYAVITEERTSRSVGELPTPNTSDPLRLSIIVLPFVSFSDNKEDEYFADGLTDDLISDLSNWTNSFVIARSTAFTFKGKAVDVRSIGQDLDVRYVLEGTARRSEGRIRVGVRLTDTRTGGQDRELAELLELQDEITGRIALALHYVLTDVGNRRARDRRSNDPNAREWEARGYAALYEPTTKTGMATARGFFENALKIDNRSLRAWSGLAQAHAADVLARWSDDPAAQLQAAEEAAAIALECGPTTPEAHFARASTFFAQRMLERALQAYATVIELGHGWPMVYARMGILNALLGRPEETRQLVEKAIRLSPRDGNLGEWYQHIGMAAFMMDQLREAILWLRRSTEANPNLGINYSLLAAACSLDGRDEEARIALSECLRIRPTMRLRKLRASPFSTHPIYLAWHERFYEGLRKAGLP
jgi:adenylate cyclase